MDKNIILSHRSSMHKTQSIHLFNVIGVVGRISPALPPDENEYIVDVNDMDLTHVIPNIQDQTILENELTFLVANSIIDNIDQMNNALRDIFPVHLDHKYSNRTSEKPTQVRGWFESCNCLFVFVIKRHYFLNSILY